VTDAARAYLHSRIDDQEAISGFDIRSGKVSGRTSIRFNTR
jgi:hypothetical protein